MKVKIQRLCKRHPNINPDGDMPCEWCIGEKERENNERTN